MKKTPAEGLVQLLAAVPHVDTVQTRRGIGWVLTSCQSGSEWSCWSRKYPRIFVPPLRFGAFQPMVISVLPQCSSTKPRGAEGQAGHRGTGTTGMVSTTPTFGRHRKSLGCASGAPLPGALLFVWQKKWVDKMGNTEGQILDCVCGCRIF